MYIGTFFIVFYTLVFTFISLEGLLITQNLISILLSSLNPINYYQKILNKTYET